MIGLKIWTTNHESFPKLRELYKQKQINYVELYIVPGSFSNKLEMLKGIPLILHAPNYNHGFSVTASNERFEKGMETVRQVVDFFGEKRIIFHPGYIQDERDTVEFLAHRLRQMPFDVILENVPKKGYKGDVVLLIHKPEEYMRVVEEAACRFCLDFGHAIAAANTEGKDGLEFIREFMALKPYMYHLSDGSYTDETDSHLHLGEGDFPLAKIASMLPEEYILSLETPKSDFKDLSEDVKNLVYLRTFLYKA